MNIFKRIKDYIEAYFIYRKLLNDLNKMTDEELKDIGLSRSDIDYIASCTLENIKVGL
jgi:uncharacterized protein YjiS (DUF1127 family)